MSVSNSSSSSSYSSECDSDESAGTGRFSGESFSSCSTVVPPEPCPLKPFGCPEYNYFWIENKSKTNPRLSYYWNYKSHAVVWTRPVPKDVPLPFYTSWVPERKVLSEDDDLPVSDFENDFERHKRVVVKKRNKRLAAEDQDDAIQVLSVEKTLKSKRMIETLWKLYRHAGESVKDVKRRLLVSSANDVQVKTEIIDDAYNTNDLTKVQIKEEPIFDTNDDTCTIIEQDNKPLSNEIPTVNIDDDSCILTEETNQPIKNEDSDSDPENVSYLIKQEYLMNYESSGDESKDEEESQQEVPLEELQKDSDEVSSENSDEYEDAEEVNINQVNSYNERNDFINGQAEQIENDISNFEYSCEEPCLLADCLDVEINENDNENVVLPDDSTVNEDFYFEDDIDWTFEKSSNNPDNSALTFSVINYVYKAPELRRNARKLLRLENRKKKEKEMEKKIPKLIVKAESPYRIKQEPDDDSDKPIVCDMYGTRTINYNHPPKVKVPQWQCCTRLSDSDDSSENDTKRPKGLKLKLINVANKDVSKETKTKSKPENALELRSWFPKPKSAKRKRRKENLDSSWYESDFADYSDIDEEDVKLVKIKKEKKSSDLEQEQKKSDAEANDLFVQTIKDEEVSDTDKERTEEVNKETEDREENQEGEEDRMPAITTPANPALDLSIVKVERRSSEESSADANAVATEPIECDADIENSDSSSSSSSSSCSCSRSSCSCGSSSSSDEDEGGNAEIEQEVVKDDF